MLLGHGVLSNSAQWLLNLEALSGVCRPVTVELYGHGEAPTPTDLKAYEPEAYMGQFEHIRQELGAERWFLCGYSLCAALTVRYALHHPQHVIGHVLTNSSSAFADSAQAREWAAAGAKTLDRAATATAAERVRLIERNPLHPRYATSLPQPVHAAMLERCQLADPLGVMRTMAITAPKASVRSSLSRNQRPALLVQGVREKAFRDHAQFAARNMPHLQLVEVDAGHGVNMQSADAFNNSLLSFVQETLSACGT